MVGHEAYWMIWAGVGKCQGKVGKLGRVGFFFLSFLPFMFNVYVQPDRL